MKETKCPHCGNWNPGEPETCGHCGKPLEDPRKAERKERARREKNSLPILKIPGTDSIWQKMWKKPVQWAQLIFISIISLIAAIASSTVH